MQPHIDANAIDKWFEILVLVTIFVLIAFVSTSHGQTIGGYLAQ